MVGKMTLQQWQAVIDVNLTGVFLCAREAAERMVKLAKGGVIVNISSISRHGNAGQTNYTAAKSGVAAMTVVWAKELARYGIRAGCVAPGFTHTDILASMKPEVLEKVIAPVPLKRLGQPDEIAHAVQFIVENDFFTGRCIDLDGGLRLVEEARRSMHRRDHEDHAYAHRTRIDRTRQQVLRHAAASRFSAGQTGQLQARRRPIFSTASASYSHTVRLMGGAGRCNE